MDPLEQERTRQREAHDRMQPAAQLVRLGAENEQLRSALIATVAALREIAAREFEEAMTPDPRVAPRVRDPGIRDLAERLAAFLETLPDA